MPASAKKPILAENCSRSDRSVGESYGLTPGGHPYTVSDMGDEIQDTYQAAEKRYERRQDKAEPDEKAQFMADK